MTELTGIPTAELQAWSFPFLLLLARIGAALAVLPGIGESAPPPMLRVGLALAITLLLLPILGPLVPAVPDAGLQMAAMAMAEAVTGLWFGWLARLLALALPMAAEFIAYLLGLSSVLQPDSSLGGQSTALSKLFAIGAPLILLISGLYTLPLTALVGLYQVIPPGTLLPAADGSAMAVKMVARIFALALGLASPFILAAIIWNTAIGLTARLVPRIQIYFVAMPGQILGGLLLLAVLSSALVSAWQVSVRGALEAMPGAG
ncbi:MAG: flagellar biosynthetic protein FliR [Acetobacteraceae bacterium]